MLPCEGIVNATDVGISIKPMTSMGRRYSARLRSECVKITPEIRRWVHENVHERNSCTSISSRLEDLLVDIEFKSR